MTTTQNDQSKPYKLHPRTGELLEPLFTWHGGHVWPVLGGDDGDDAGGGNPDSEPGTDDTDDAGDGSGGNDSEPVTRADFDKLRNQLSAADKARAAAEKKLKEIDDSKKDELTRATERAEELEKAVQARDSELAEARLQIAFLTADTGITWHDPGDALALAERTGYLKGVVGDDGTVDGKALATKLKELAKAKPHLVKTGDSSDSGGKNNNNGSGSGKTGGNVGGKGGKNKGDEPDLSRYSRVLNR